MLRYLVSEAGIVTKVYLLFEVEKQYAGIGHMTTNQKHLLRRGRWPNC